MKKPLSRREAWEVSTWEYLQVACRLWDVLSAKEVYTGHYPFTDAFIMSANAVVRMETTPELPIVDDPGDGPFAAEVEDDLFEADMQRVEERLAREYPMPSPEDYLEFVRRAVERGRADIAAGRWKTHAQLEAERAAWRANLRQGTI